MRLPALIAALFLSAAAHGQSQPSFNVDVGRNVSFPVPSAAFGAASGQTGSWNAVSADGGATTLVDVNGAATGVEMQKISGLTDFEYDNPNTTGDVERLLDDIGQDGIWQIRNLPNGNYRLYAYAWGPDDPIDGINTFEVVGGTNGRQVCGGSQWGGTWKIREHYVVDYVAVTDGTLQFSVGSGNGSYVSFNGLQLSPADPPGRRVCFGDGSSGDCPCDNNSHPGHGCGHSWGKGAWLGAIGSNRSDLNDLRLSVTYGPWSTTGIMLQGTGGQAVPFKDGLLCLSAPIKRIQVVALKYHTGISKANVAIKGGVLPGQTWTYQFWFRDDELGPCGTRSNLSSAYEITWQ